MHRLGRHEIHAWTVSFGPEDGLDDSVLSADERARAWRYCFDRDRRRFVHFRTALRKLVAAYLSSTPDEVAFEYDSFGKPSVKSSGMPRLQFNLSHSDDVALVCFSRSSPPGVDVERVRELKDLELTAARVMSASELARFHQLPEGMRSRAFFLAWTRKEAVLKAQGVGLSGTMRTIEVSMDRCETLAIERSGSAIVSSWRVWPIDAGADYEASLAIRTGPAVDVIERVYQAFLSC